MCDNNYTTKMQQLQKNSKNYKNVPRIIQELSKIIKNYKKIASVSNSCNSESLDGQSIGECQRRAVCSAEEALWHTERE